MYGCINIVGGFPGCSDGIESTCSAGDPDSILFGKIPWRRKWLHTPVFLPGESHGQKGLRDTVHKVAKSWTQLIDFTWTVNFKMFKLDLEKAEESEIKLPTSAGSSKKQDSSRKTSLSALTTMPKPLIVWITTNCEKFLKRWKYQTIWPASWEICMQDRKQQLELDIEQQIGSKSGK